MTEIEALEETIDVMGNPRLMGDIRESLAEPESESITLSKDDALRLASDR